MNINETGERNELMPIDINGYHKTCIRIAFQGKDRPCIMRKPARVKGGVSKPHDQKGTLPQLWGPGGGLKPLGKPQPPRWATVAS